MRSYVSSNVLPLCRCRGRSFFFPINSRPPSSDCLITPSMEYLSANASSLLVVGGEMNSLIHWFLDVYCRKIRVNALQKTSWVLKGDAVCLRFGIAESKKRCCVFFFQLEVVWSFHVELYRLEKNTHTKELWLFIKLILSIVCINPTVLLKFSHLCYAFSYRSVFVFIRK